MRIAKNIEWPEIIDLKGMNPIKAVERIADILSRFRKTILLRDGKIAQAVNSMDVEQVSSVPTDPPEYGQTALRLYHNAGVYRLYAFVNGTWVSTILS